MAGGRPTEFSIEKKNEIFNEYSAQFIENGRIPPKNDPLWSLIKSTHNLPQVVTHASIYTAMAKKFRELLPKESSDIVSSDIVSSDVVSSDDCLIEMPGKKFHINISAKNWEWIKPITAIYHRAEDNEHRKLNRSYNVLKPGVWTYVLSRAISRDRKDVPCRWTFKRCKVSHMCSIFFSYH